MYFRHGQRRTDPITDGEFCFGKDDTGYDDPSKTVHGGTAKRLTKAALDANTVIVKPWWLYSDYRAKAPSDLISPAWAKKFPGFQLGDALLTEPDGHTRATQIRVCKEEAQTAENGVIFTTGTGTGKQPMPSGRVTKAPIDTALAKAATGKTVSCLTGSGFRNSAQCGCGIGVERCLPGPAAFIMPIKAPLGTDLPFEAGTQSVSEWVKLWWAQEANKFFERIFDEDRDFREVLLARWTEVNGPLAQFYKFVASSTCCGPGAEIGYLKPEALVDPMSVPDTLAPVDTQTWLPIADRGPHAAGILTMPVFLTKYGSRRARANVVYNAFLCKDFVAAKVKLEPSTEPDLTKRQGCSSCHHTLEPMAAYFTRITESDWTWLPPTTFPLGSCADKPKSATCTKVYDPAFGMLRSAYASPDHAEAGPIGLAKEVTSSPEFAPCVVKNIAQSLLGRPLAPEDDGWRQELIKTFVDGGYRVRALVKAIVRSPAYRMTYASRTGAP